MTAAPNLLAATASALVASLWQVAALVTAAWLVSILLAQRSAALRHMVGMAFLLACAVAPIVTFARVLSAPTIHADIASNLVAIAPPAVIVWLWGAGVALKLVQLATGWIAFREFEARASMPLPPEWKTRIERLKLRFGISRPVSVRLLADTLPCSARLLRPVIWLPASLLTRLSPEQIEAVLAHELAHVRRLDWLWNGLQCAVEALLFYHPAVWWLSRRIRQERENACDDLAVSVCGDPIVVAEALGSLEAMRAPMFVLSAQGGLLMTRISRLLMKNAGRPARWTLPLAALTLVGVGAMLAMQSERASANEDTPRWWQRHGAAVNIEAQVGSEQRHYVRWLDGNGQFRERFVVNGQPKVIDANARKWIDEAANAPPAPPPPPPMPPIPAMPPLATMADDPAYTAAVAALRSDPAMQPALGVSTAIRLGGPSRITRGSVKLTLAVEGPEGTRRLLAIRDTRDGDWRFEPARAEKH